MNLLIALGEPIEFIKMKTDLLRLSPAQLEEKYAWLNVYNPYDTPFTKEDFEKMKAEANEDEIRADEEKRKENQSAFLAFLQSVKEDGMRRKAEIVHRYVFMKTDRIDAWKKAMFLLKPFFDYLASLEKELTVQDACNLTSAEVVGMLSDGAMPCSIDNLKLRSANKALYFFHKQVVEIASNPREISRIRAVIEIGHEAGFVKGVAACTGFATGTAKIIRHSEDLHKILEGDVFIAKYTFPTFTPYMLKCKAILTDEGGLTTHAAIISREYGIPCIVGTKHATKVFKDGDVVEVDAASGTARKIS